MAPTVHTGAKLSTPYKRYELVIAYRISQIGDVIASDSSYSYQMATVIVTNSYRCGIIGFVIAPSSYRSTMMTITIMHNGVMI